MANSRNKSELDKFYNLAVKYGIMDSIDQSKDLLHMLEDQEGGKGWGNYSYGQIHSALGKWDEAIKYFNKANSIAVKLISAPAFLTK